MVFNLVDKEGTKGGKDLNFSLFGLNDGKHDAKILRELGELYKDNVDHVNEFNQKIKGLTYSSRDNAKAMKANSSSNAEFSKGLLEAAANADKMTISTRLSTMAMNALNIAKSVALNMAVMAGISLVMAAVKYAVKYIAEYNKRVNETADASNEAFKKSSDTIKDYSSQIDELSGKIKALESLDSINIFQKEELDNLKKTNAELERKLLIEKALNEIDARKSEKDTLNAINLKDNKILNEMVPKDGKQPVVSFGNVGQLSSVDDLTAFKSTASGIEKQRELIAALKIKQDEFLKDGSITDQSAWDKYELQIKNVETVITRLDSELSTFYKNSQKSAEALRALQKDGYTLSEESKEFLADFDTAEQKFLSLYDKNIKRSGLKKILDSKDFDKVNDKLVSLQKSGGNLFPHRLYLAILHFLDIVKLPS